MVQTGRTIGETEEVEEEKEKDQDEPNSTSESLAASTNVSIKSSLSQKQEKEKVQSKSTEDSVLFNQPRPPTPSPALKVPIGTGIDPVVLLPSDPRPLLPESTSHWATHPGLATSSRSSSPSNTNTGSLFSTAPPSSSSSRFEVTAGGGVGDEETDPFSYPSIPSVLSKPIPYSKPVPYIPDSDESPVPLLLTQTPQSGIRILYLLFSRIVFYSI